MGCVKPMPVVEKGQVSIETLLLAAVVLMISITVLSYYAQIKDSTTAMQLLKVEALKKVDETQGLTVIEKIDYKIAGGQIDLCLFTDPGGLLDGIAKTAVEDLIEEKTEFGTVNIFEIYSALPDGDPANSCE